MRLRADRCSLHLEDLAVDLDLVPLACAGGLERSSELLLSGRHFARDAEATIGPEDAKALAVGPGPVNEEVDEAFGRSRRDLRWAELEERSLQLVDAGTGHARDAKDAHDSLVLDVELRGLGLQVGLVQDHRLRSLLEPRAVGVELAVDRREALG